MMFDAQHCAYRSVVNRSGPFGDRPSSYAEIAADLKGHGPGSIREALWLLVWAGSLVSVARQRSLMRKRCVRLRKYKSLSMAIGDAMKD
jgi:hypothetical protein